jgi:hypothetical protein
MNPGYIRFLPFEIVRAARRILSFQAAAEIDCRSGPDQAACDINATLHNMTWSNVSGKQPDNYRLSYRRVG